MSFTIKKESDVVVVDGSSIKRAQREILQTIPIVGFFYSFVF